MKQLLPLQRVLRSITVATSIYGFANSLVGVFTPLIILKSGKTLSTIAGFYVVYAVVKLLINYPVIKIIQRYGAHVGLASAFISASIQFASIFGFIATKQLEYLVFAAAATALANAFLWGSQHLHISRVMDNATKSSSMATIAIIKETLGILGPLLGGFIGVTLGPLWLLAAALLVSMTALIPLKSMGRLEGNRPSETRLSYDLSGAPRRDLWANFCFNIDTAVGVFVWPIFLAVSIGTFRGIGLISGLAAAVTMIVLWVAGHRGDHGRDRSVLQEGVTINSFVHVMRIFASSPVSMAVISSAYQSSLAYFSNAWTSTYYHHAKTRGPAYVMSMEIACDAAYLLLWSLFFLFTFAVPVRVLFVVVFAIAAVSSWGCLAITRQRKYMESSF